LQPGQRQLPAAPAHQGVGEDPGAAPAPVIAPGQEPALFRLAEEAPQSSPEASVVDDPVVRIQRLKAHVG